MGLKTVNNILCSLPPSSQSSKTAMEASSDPNMVPEQTTKKKGGFRTLPFIIGNEAFEKVASYGLLPNMILYLMRNYHMSVAKGTTVLSIWQFATNFLPTIGGFISDSYLGRYRTITYGCLTSFLGMVLLWLTAMIRHATPPYCNISSHNCKSATPIQLTFLYLSLMLMSIGAGGIRAASLAFAADQLTKPGDPKNKRVMNSFFNWYYISATLSVLIALTVIVYIQDQFGWKVGFGVPTVVMFVSTILFLMASSLYIKAKPNKSLFTGFAQVTIAAFRNRHNELPPKLEEEYYHHIADSNIVVPTEKLSFLNKACAIRDGRKDYQSNRPASNPWNLCTVEQVEELKALLKIIPMWSTGISLAINIGQNTFPVLQANSMDRHLTSHFQIPAGSFSLFSVATVTIWLMIYDRLIIPQLKKITGNPSGLSLKQRMGTGLVVSCMAMALSAIVESIRRRAAIRQGFAETPEMVLDMSAMWLVPQYCLNGVAEAFNIIGQVEFYYSQFPKSMSSIAISLYGLGTAIASLLVGVIVNIVDDVTKRGGNESWVSSNLNKGHYDYYYWILTIISGINFLYYLLCCWAYGPCDGERAILQNKDQVVKEEQEELSKSMDLPIVKSG